MAEPESSARPAWNSTGDTKFPLAARVAGCWWVLRMNPFPDHCLWTLFIDGVARYDLDDAPPNWNLPGPRSAPPLDAETVDTLLTSLRDLSVYGSEVGLPCADLFCCG